MKQKLKIFILFTVFLGVMYVIPGEKKALYNIITGQKAQDFSLFWPFSSYLLEPLVAFCQYVLSLISYSFQLLSWVFWLLVGCILTAAARKKLNFKKIAGNYTGILLVFLSLITAVLIMPLPAPRLNVPPGHTKIDFHSHTYYSYDAIDSPNSNLRFHNKLGFDMFFATEQQNTESLKYFPVAEQLNKVFPGVQVRTRDGNALLILGDKNFDGKEFRRRTNKEIIDLAHSKNLLVVCPHWWKWRKPSVEEIYEAGVDGFEVYNPGYKQITEDERNWLIAFCKEKNLLMTSATDWHGWGSISNAWTVVKGDAEEVKKRPIEYLKNRSETLIIAYKKAELQNNIRFIFEPFFALYYYFSGINIYQCLGWAFWAVIILLLAYLKRVVYSVISLGFFGGTVYYFLLSLTIKGNETIFPLVVPALFILGFGWLFAARNAFLKQQ